MKKILAALLCVLLLAQTVVFANQSFEYESVTSDSTSYYTRTGGSTSVADASNKLFDGDTATGTGYGTAGGADYIYGDLGEGGKQVDKVVITAYDKHQRTKGMKFYLANTLPVSGTDKTGWLYLGEVSSNPTALDSEGAVSVFELDDGQAGVWRYVVADLTGSSSIGGYVQEIEVFKIKATLQPDEDEDEPQEPDTDDEPDVLYNISEGKAAFSYTSVWGTSPYLAIDGDETTFWESTTETTVLHDNFVIDLGMSYPINAIEIILASQYSTNVFSIYGSNNIQNIGKTKICDVNASSDFPEIYKALSNAESYRYIIFDAPPSSGKMGFSEIRIMSSETPDDIINSVSLMSEAKTTIGTTYKSFVDNIDVSNTVDTNPESRVTSNFTDHDTREIAYYVDLGVQVPVSHVIYQGTDRGNNSGVDNQNDSITGFKIVATNEAPSETTNYVVLGSKSGHPYVGDRIASDMYTPTDPEIYDTGIWVFPVDNEQSFRYVGIVKDTPADGGNQLRLAVNTFQVYSKISDVSDYVEEQNVDYMIVNESTTIEDSYINYNAEVLNGATVNDVIALFGQRNLSGKLIQRSYSSDTLELNGAYNDLDFSADISDGTLKDTVWEMIVLNGRKASDCITNLSSASLQRTEKYIGDTESHADFKKTGLNIEVSGKVGASVLGMIILRPNGDGGAKSFTDFSASDIYSYEMLTCPENSSEPWNYTMTHTLSDSADAGIYTIGFFSDTGALTDKTFELIVYDMDEIKNDFSSVKADTFIGIAEKYEEFFGKALIDELKSADMNTSIGSSFIIAKSGMTEGMFDSTLTEWRDINTITSAMFASLIVDAIADGTNISETIDKYGTYMPDIFDNSDYNSDEFEDILPSVLKTIKPDSAQNIADACKRTIALSLIADGDIASREKALKDYFDALGINEDTLNTSYSALQIAGKLSSDISKVKAEYASGMDGIVSDVISNLEKEYSEDNTTILGSDKKGGNKGGTVSFGSSYTPDNTFVGGIVEESKQDIVFYDIETYDWAKSSIMSLYNRGIIAGVGNNTFAPDGLLTREQAVKLVVLAMGLPTNESDNGYRDCLYGSWYYPYITSAKVNNLVNGVSRGVFGLGQYVTRQDLAVMIYRAMEQKNIADSMDTKSFTDDEHIADYARDAVAVLGGSDIITGFEDGSFGAYKNATRAEAAVIVERFLKILEASTNGGESV